MIPIAPRTALWLLLPWLLALPGSAAAVSCELIPTLARQYARNHVVHNDLDEQMELRTIDTYIRRADPTRTLFLEAEAEQLAEDLRGIFRRVSKGDCSRLEELQRDLLARSEEVVAFVRSVVEAEDFALDPDVELVIDADDRGFPATQEAREQVLRSLVHFQLSNYLSADTPLEEAKERLVHRWELRQKRLAELEKDDLYSAYLDALANSLDPHSSYLSPDVLEDFQIQMTLSLEGIGVALSERDGYAVAERIIPGGAADRHKGLVPKDKIIAVAQEGGEPVDIIDMPLREAVGLIRGKKGTKVGLTVLRQGEKTERFQIEIVRDKIDLTEQAAKLHFEEREVDGRTIKLAVLELPSFYGHADPSERQSSDDVARLLAEVNESGADGLVLDLSRNGGGLLEHAVTISGYFLRRGDVVSIENGRGQRQRLADRDERVLYAGPLVVLTSRASASASEILAGALKDYARAVIVGDDHTFGKGTVQTVQTLPPGQGALKITTATFFRPGGKSTQHGGVEADVVVPSPLASDDFGEKSQRYSLPEQSRAGFLSRSANSSKPGARWRPVTSEQLALLATKSRVRVESSEDFAEIREALDRQRANNGVVRLADMLKEQEEAEAEAQADDGAADEPEATAEVADADEEELEKTPQLEEALWVLSDLVSLNGEIQAAQVP